MKHLNHGNGSQAYIHGKGNYMNMELGAMSDQVFNRNKSEVMLNFPQHL